MKNDSGFFLVMVLILLSFIALVVLDQLQMARLQFQVVNQQQDRDHAFEKLERQAQYLLFSQWNKKCVIRETATSEVLLKRVIKKQGCFSQDESYLYSFLIQDLGVFPCLKTTRQHLVYSTHHWFLYLVVWSKQPLFLQLRVVNSEADSPCALKKSLFIDTGVVSWRHLLLSKEYDYT